MKVDSVKTALDLVGEEIAAVVAQLLRLPSWKPSTGSASTRFAA
jgi:hypothetical protein